MHRRTLASHPLLIGALALSLMASLASMTRAQLSLTDAGTARGFRLTDFITGFVTADLNTPGPLGAAFRNTGEVIVTDYWNGNTMLFPNDADGLDVSAGTVTQHYGPGNTAGLAQTPSDYQAQQSFYMTQQTNGQVIQINEDGTFNKVIVEIEHATGIAPNPVNGQLFVSQAGGGENAIFLVDPVAQTKTLFSTVGADGLMVDPSGSSLYAASGSILAYDIATGQVIFDSGPIDHIDGVALGLYTIAGHAYATTTDGNLWEVNLETGEKTLIATGGSRGDFIAVDPNGGQNRFGTLLVTQSDRIMRLIPPGGGLFFGPPGANTASLPEPGAVSLLAGMSLFGLMAARRSTLSKRV